MSDMTGRKKKLEDDVGHPKYRQHFAVHECEAWLLSHPDGLPPEVKKNLPGKHVNPETVNFNEPPKKLLQRLYKDKLRESYKEIVHGSELFGGMEPNTAYNKCPRFKSMLDDMLGMAKAAGL
jgi:hypothetical protein